MTLLSPLTHGCPPVFTLQNFLASDSPDLLGLDSPQVCEWGRLLCCCGRCHLASSRGDFHHRLVVSEVRATREGKWAAEQLWGGTEEGLFVFGIACSLPIALACRLSPEIYLKRPAHSDDWRLDIMLKRKAVRNGWLWRVCVCVWAGGHYWKDCIRNLPGRLGIRGFKTGNVPFWLSVYQISSPGSL